MEPVLSPETVADLLAADPPPVVLDVRWALGGPPGYDAYVAGHLPGAVFVDLGTELAAPPGSGGRHPLPDPEDLQRVLRRAGVCADRPVVVYDAADATAAARAWWLLRWAGHREVAVLDGGFRAWTTGGGAVSTETPSPPPGDVVVRPGAMPILDVADVATVGRHGVLLDARAPARYRGETEPVDPVAGHIPGAVNAPATTVTDDDGRWPRAEVLRSRIEGWMTGAGAGAGVDVVTGAGVDVVTGAGVDVVTGAGVDVVTGAEPREIAAYCGSGVTACTLVLALEQAGITDVDHPAALYPGSWSQWCADPSRPVVVGADPG